MSSPERGADAATLGLFAVAVLLGASNFLAVRFSNLGLPPFWGAGLRFALAAVIFTGIAVALRVRLPRGRVLVMLLLFGVLNIAGFYAFMYWALLFVTAGVAAVVLALVPLATVLLATLQRLERLRVRSLIGGVMALGGIASMTLEPERIVLPAGALLAMLAAVACVGQSMILAKHISVCHPAGINAVGMSVGAVLLLALSAAVGEPWSWPDRAEAGWALAYLVTVGSVGLFLVTLIVIRRWTASSTSYMFVLFPVGTMLLEAVIVREPITLPAAVGAGLVMIGVWVGAFAPSRPPAARAPETPAA